MIYGLCQIPLYPLNCYLEKFDLIVDFFCDLQTDTSTVQITK